MLYTLNPREPYREIHGYLECPLKLVDHPLTFRSSVALLFYGLNSGFHFAPFVHKLTTNLRHYVAAWCVFEYALRHACCEQTNLMRPGSQKIREVRTINVESAQTTWQTLSGQKGAKRAIWELKFLNSILWDKLIGRNSSFLILLEYTIALVYARLFLYHQQCRLWFSILKETDSSPASSCWSLATLA